MIELDEYKQRASALIPVIDEIAEALDHEGPFYEVIVHRNNLQLVQ